jgi:thiol-disulfide isomerase/thioredoxin
MPSFPEKPNDLLEILVNTKCTVLKFGASWCGPCKNKEFLDSYHKLKNHYTINQNVQFFEFDIDDYEQIVNETNLYNFNISAVPTIKVFSNGVHINTYTGTSSLEKVLNDIESVIKE